MRKPSLTSRPQIWCFFSDCPQARCPAPHYTHHPVLGIPICICLYLGDGKAGIPVFSVSYPHQPGLALHNCTFGLNSQAETVSLNILIGGVAPVLWKCPHISREHGVQEGGAKWQADWCWILEWRGFHSTCLARGTCLYLPNHQRRHGLGYM